MSAFECLFNPHRLLTVQKEYELYVTLVSEQPDLFYHAVIIVLYRHLA
jgi:hypothetical protein